LFFNAQKVFSSFDKLKIQATEVTFCYLLFCYLDGLNKTQLLMKTKRRVHI